MVETFSLFFICYFVVVEVAVLHSKNDLRRWPGWREKEEEKEEEEEK
jgi:hypothetical protein